MKILALIPARGGSKRLPNKNILPLGGKPLISWTIDAVKDTPEIVDILVSTDSCEIASVARAAGALVPWLRPDVLSTDTATSMDVCLHALDWYEEKYGDVDGLLLLQPTSPFRDKSTIKKGIELFESHHGERPVASFSPADTHPSWCFKVNGDRIEPFLKGVNLEVRSQDLGKAYVINGALYLGRPSYLRESRSFINGATLPLLIESMPEGLDIDTVWDWNIAESILNTRVTS